MEENGLSFEEMHEMVRLIDSNYKVGDKNGARWKIKKMRCVERSLQ